MRRHNWTNAEDNALLFGINRGHDRKEIAQVLGITLRQLTKRLYILRERGQVTYE